MVAVELGSGVGLTALALSSLGWDVLATDRPHVIDNVLSHNVHTNVDGGALPSRAGRLEVRELDWFEDPEHWNWRDPKSITSPTLADGDGDEPGFGPPFDLILTADTVYSRELVTPLLRTIHGLSWASFHAAAAETPKHPVVYLCLEKRDPALVLGLLDEAKEKWGFSVTKVPSTKLAKSIEKLGSDGTGGWTKEDWEGVEIWKLKLKVPGA